MSNRENAQEEGKNVLHIVQPISIAFRKTALPSSSVPGAPYIPERPIEVRVRCK